MLYTMSPSLKERRNIAFCEDLHYELKMFE